MASSKIPQLVEKSDLIKLIQNVQENFDVFLPYQTEYDGEDNLSYKKYSGDNDFVLNKYRTVDPLKTLFYLTSESVLPPTAESGKRIIFGPKNCDLFSLKIYDKALLEDNFVEPNFKIWRDNTYIISSDCDSFLSTCHCNIMEHTPYPKKDEELFDLNLSQVDDKFVITIGSEKGEELLKLFQEHCDLRNASDQILEEVESQHQKADNAMAKINEEFLGERDYSKISKNQDSGFWSEISKECVGCAGCTNICPSCYCIIVNDESIGSDFKRIRTWDSCQLTGYAEVAGGGTPRPKVWERFRNRYQCKFDFMESNFSQYGCAGCGRCIEVCPAEIDKREVIKKLQEV